MPQKSSCYLTRDTGTINFRQPKIGHGLPQQARSQMEFGNEAKLGGQVLRRAASLGKRNRTLKKLGVVRNQRGVVGDEVADAGLEGVVEEFAPATGPADVEAGGLAAGLVGGEEGGLVGMGEAAEGVDFF